MELEQKVRLAAKIIQIHWQIVVVQDDIIPWHDDRGILYIGIEEFLLNEASLDL